VSVGEIKSKPEKEDNKPFPLVVLARLDPTNIYLLRKMWEQFELLC
jgi:hypothetical protein